MRNLFGLFLLICLLYLAVEGCGEKPGFQQQSTNKSEFNWKDNFENSDLPDFPVKGFLNGEEVRFSYIILEKWRGSKDNVLNFSVTKPEQSCGFIENYRGFQLIKRGGMISEGDWKKLKFHDSPGDYQAFYKYISVDGNSFKSDFSWNCTLKIESFTSKNVTGKIALCFNDDKKSWIAGKFDAVICNN